jgi:hypothetical protein
MSRQQEHASCEAVHWQWLYNEESTQERRQQRLKPGRMSKQEGPQVLQDGTPRKVIPHEWAIRHPCSSCCNIRACRRPQHPSAFHTQCTGYIYIRESQHQRFRPTWMSKIHWIRVSIDLHRHWTRSLNRLTSACVGRGWSKRHDTVSCEITVRLSYLSRARSAAPIKYHRAPPHSMPPCATTGISQARYLREVQLWENALPQLKSKWDCDRL